MKKVLLAMLLIASTISLKAQKISKYISLGISVTNGDTLTLASYPSVEFGVSKENISLGLVLGRGNLRFSDRDAISRYFYEGKVTASEQFGGVKGFVLAGLGNYITTNHIFIEYGGGLCKSFKNTDYFIQASNFDGQNYISLGATFNF